MQQYQGIHYTYIPIRRCPVEKLQDMLFVFDFFTNGIPEYLLRLLYSESLSGHSKFIDTCVKKGLIEETRDNVYVKIEKGTECNILWYAIEDKFRLGEVKNGEENLVSGSMISSIIHVGHLQPDKKIDEILENASNYKGKPNYPIPGKTISKLQNHISFLRLLRRVGYDIFRKKYVQISMYNIYSGFKNYPYGNLLKIRDNLSVRSLIELHDPAGEKAKHEDVRITETGIALLNTLNWYTNTHEIVDFLPLKI